ncbi:class I SAM-dependent methyltransferase [Nonlabens ponticola]|uniref:Class I SAM-dependent methyltransferase n=2 Tax=Nonlabens ponticola TaxID=2496866 RepID=A0A3S9N107_9FLAO|nr:class I SAM-dependent methyltransferase [Nonlabens ponticola]
MSDWKNMWDERYAKDEYAYGLLPNVFFAQQLDQLANGKLLLPAEGEGRNAVHAARSGWEVHAFDISEQAQEKAQKLAENNDVELHYQVGDLPDLDYEEESFDAIALVFGHFPADIRQDYHKRLIKLLKKGGVLILEGFDEQHLAYREKNPKVGGPKTEDLLFTKDEITETFQDFEIKRLEQAEVELKEGNYHDGTGHVIRFVGIKN